MIQSVSINHTWRDDSGKLHLDQIKSSSETVKADRKVLLDLPNTVTVDIILTYKGRDEFDPDSHDRLEE